MDLLADADPSMPLRHGRGTVFGALLNGPGALAALGAQVHQAPYKAPPRAPVLYIKPRNTIAGQGQAVEVPADAVELEVGATLAVVIARPTTNVGVDEALACVAGYTVANDLCVPHASLYRPALRMRCRDGFCPIGPAVVPRAAVANPDALAIEVSIDGRIVRRGSTAGLLRPVATLIADVSEFMTLHTGDVLLVGVAAGAPRARAGQTVTIAIDGVGRLETPLVAEAAP